MEAGAGEDGAGEIDAGQIGLLEGCVGQVAAPALLARPINEVLDGAGESDARQERGDQEYDELHQLHPKLSSR